MSKNIYIGKNSISNLREILKLHFGKKVFLVTGKNSYKKCGAQKIMESLLKGNKYFRFFEFEENPKLEDVKKGITFFNKENCEITISIGGGSTIDIAKLINSLSVNQEDIVETIKKNRLDQKPFPLVAIPTTAGTGSEVTQFAVLYIDGKKYSFTHKHLLPEYVIVDSQFTYSTPPYLTACAGADAFCQAVESIWAIGGNKESKEYAEKSIQLVWDNLVEAVVNNNHLSKDAVMEGAYWAGKAINISKTTASHALSYKMTSLFGVPHGHAVAITLSQIMKVNFEYAKKDIQRIFNIIKADDLSEGVEKINKFWSQIGLGVRLRELGITEKDISVLSICNLERLNNNPVKLSRLKIENLLREIV